MAATATSRAGQSARRKASAGKARAKPSGRAGKTRPKGARKTGASAVRAAGSALFEPTAVTGKLARKAVKRAAGQGLEAGLHVLRIAGEKLVAAGGNAPGTEETTGRRRLPIQRSVDVAVPLRVAWGEWMAFAFIPEGVHTITEIERDGDLLAGRVAGPGGPDWWAEILDERDEQSFAWQSHASSDCAGLVTFHELSDRLTRIELNLDVIPITVAHALRLFAHLADRGAETDLRRFKAQAELINPDLYEEGDGDAREPDPGDGEQAQE